MLDQKSYKNLEEINRKAILENTFYYVENYLNPNKKWNKEITPRQRLNQIRYANVNWRIVSDHIKGMSYQNFLKTPYWQAITAHTKYKAGYRCQLCNRADYLVTHHRNYAIHGREHAHMQELIALCNNCHNNFHGKFPKCELQTVIILMIVILTVLPLFFVYLLIERTNVL